MEGQDELLEKRMVGWGDQWGGVQVVLCWEKDLEVKHFSPLLSPISPPAPRSEQGHTSVSIQAVQEN